ncbi:hypothetical protein CLAIMM_12613 [Cladophialophora immunda]|nr:hypothetical protein CLAIMM_12613 [Cladophialophora immunda]
MSAPLTLFGKVALTWSSVIVNYPYDGERDNAIKVVQSLDKHSHSITIKADLSTVEGPEILAKEAAAAFGRIDILVNNTGVALAHNIDDPDDAKVLSIMQKMLDINSRGTYLLTRAVLKVLSRENSRIVNISSGSSRSPGTGLSMYAGTKGMIDALTRSWAKELPRKYGCTVNAVAPGVTGTQSFYEASPQFREFLQPHIDDTPVAPRVARPEEVAWAVAMLCEEEAGWINGAYLPVGGGSTMV